MARGDLLSTCRITNSRTWYLKWPSTGPWMKCVSADPATCRRSWQRLQCLLPCECLTPGTPQSLCILWRARRCRNLSPRRPLLPSPRPISRSAPLRASYHRFKLKRHPPSPRPGSRSPQLLAATYHRFRLRSTVRHRHQCYHSQRETFRFRSRGILWVGGSTRRSSWHIYIISSSSSSSSSSKFLPSRSI